MCPEVVMAYKDEEILLEKVRFCLQKDFRKGEFAELAGGKLDLVEGAGWIKELFTLRFTKYIWTEKICDMTQVVSYPASWWQHLKRDYLPTLCRWFPVKEQEIAVRFKRVAHFPRFNYDTEGNRVIFVLRDAVDFTLVDEEI